MTQAIEAIVRSTDRKTTSGSSCCFIPLTETQGIKLYATKLERDASFVALSVAAEHGLAPAVGECIDFSDLVLAEHERPSWWPEGFIPAKLYGFVTEKVAMLDYDERERRWSETRDLADSLRNIFGKYVEDIGGFNIGKNSAGKIVALDLDGRFSGLLTYAEIDSVTAEWGGGYW